MNNRILSLFALVFALGIFFMYVEPTWNGAIAETKVKIANDEQALAAAAAYSDQQQALASARNAIPQENLTKLETLLPDSVNNVGLILDLNALAARSGISLSNLDVAAVNTNSSVLGALPAAASPIGSINLSLSAAGSYTAFQSFLQGIEKSARILDIQDIAVKGSDTGVYAYQVKMRLYWLR